MKNNKWTNLYGKNHENTALAILTTVNLQPYHHEQKQIVEPYFTIMLENEGYSIPSLIHFHPIENTTTEPTATVLEV